MQAPTIASITATPVNVPMRAPYRFSFGTLASFTTTIIEVVDSDGVTGIGESPHGDLSRLVQRMARLLVGLPIDALNECESRCVSRTGFSLWEDAATERRAFGGIEIALWDLRAKRAGVPLVELLGGAVRDTVAFTEYFAFREGAEETISDVVRYCADIVEEFAAPTFEGKLGVYDLETEMLLVGELVRELGPGCVLRLDANGAYTVPTARLVCRQLAELGVGWLEDPCRTLDETARLRADGVPISFSTHEVDLRRAARDGVPDAFCIDASELGGLRRTQDFARACAALGVDFWCYSGDAGVMTALYLHLTASEPTMIRPHQSLFRFTADVVIEQGHWSPVDGVLPVPTEPGLGVTLDRAALARMHQRFLDEGAMAAAADPGQAGSYGSAFRQQ
ncbi:MAG: chloromuconate cycloisomerase [Ilumatobacteraceae bacterium]|nr:chloromuconate cycloisomerase [Ilumatobacteraceae bacterium]